MDVTPNTRTITEYTLTLSEADARQALDDPYTFAAALVERLRPHLTAENGSGRKYAKPKPASQLRPPAKPRTPALAGGARGGGVSRKPNGRGPKAKTAKRTGLQRVRCPHCSQEIAQKYLNLHLAKKHNSLVDTTPAPSADVAA
ncbi:MAG: hypothetical protein IT318_23930 [Anaerolineales bacterium]|nr:hypothetical protein [Anaerolineales bacterium]